jgi:nitrilase
MRHIAVEGRCFVLSANQFCRRRDYPAGYPLAHGTEPDAVLSRGGSCIVDPFGNFLAGPNFEGEAILVAELDRAQIVRGKYDLDVVGHYARPDIFQLQVDERQKEPVTTRAAETSSDLPNEASARAPATPQSQATGARLRLAKKRR